MLDSQYLVCYFSIALNCCIDIPFSILHSANQSLLNALHCGGYYNQHIRPLLSIDTAKLAESSLGCKFQNFYTGRLYGKIYPDGPFFSFSARSAPRNLPLLVYNESLLAWCCSPKQQELWIGKLEIFIVKAAFLRHFDGKLQKDNWSAGEPDSYQQIHWFTGTGKLSCRSLSSIFRRPRIAFEFKLGVYNAHTLAKIIEVAISPNFSIDKKKFAGQAELVEELLVLIRKEYKILNLPN